MKTVEVTLATSHVDGKDDVLSLEALNTLIEDNNTHYIPIGIENDPRLPDSGRFISAELVDLEKGQFAVKGTGELFEEGDVIEFDESREMPIREYNGINIIHDRNFGTEEEQALIQELSSLLSAAPQEEVKKSVESLNVFLVGAGIFIIGKFANAFRDDIRDYASFKNYISSIMTKKRSGESLLECEFSSLIKENQIISISVILTDPNDKDIDLFFEQGIQDLDALLETTLKGEDFIQRIVLEYQKEKLKILYAIRKDAVPLIHVAD